MAQALKHLVGEFVGRSKANRFRPRRGKLRVGKIPKILKPALIAKQSMRAAIGPAGVAADGKR